MPSKKFIVVSVSSRHWPPVGSHDKYKSITIVSLGVQDKYEYVMRSGIINQDVAAAAGFKIQKT